VEVNDRDDFTPETLKMIEESAFPANAQRVADGADTLTMLFTTDQEIEATAGMVGRHYERLRASGIPKAAAVEMCLTYNAMIVGQHFGMDVSTAFGVGPTYEGE